MKSATLRRLVIILLAAVAVLAGGAVQRVQDVCGPFTDVSPAFCPYVLEMYYLGITAGTSPTTYSPDATVTRGQAAVFVSKGVNQAIARRSPRAALGQWWTATPHWDMGLGTTHVGAAPTLLQSDGVDLWVPNFTGATVSRVRASDGRLLETWTGAPDAYAALVAAGRIFVIQDTTATQNPGSLYMIDPTQPPGDVTVAATGLGSVPLGIAFDGARIWTANYGSGASGGSISIVTPGPSLPWSVKTVSTGFIAPQGIVFDGSNMWTADWGDSQLKKLDSNGAILQAVPVGSSPRYPAFDGANVWVSSYDDDTVTVVHAATGVVLATLSGNGLSQPLWVAFDGQRALVTSPNADRISLFRAADLTPIGSFDTGPASSPYGACSDGINFWVSLAPDAIGRF